MEDEAMTQRKRRAGRTGRGSEALPRARREGVLATDVGDEIVVYDSKQHRGHCLNRPAAVVWRHLDGRTSVDELVGHLRDELDGPADEAMVWLALEQLDRAQLLEGRLDKPAARGVSRRQALRRLGIAAGTGAVVLPAISSILAPPAHAQVSAVACGSPEPDCATFSCPGGCACVPTTEGATVCVVPSCVSACTTSADCPPGSVCFTLGCCGPATFCVPIAPAGTSCFAPVQSPSWR
jgi:hypothetical protein